MEERHIKKIFEAYKKFETEEGFCRVVEMDEILEKKASLNVPLYVSNVESNGEKINIEDALRNWEEAGKSLKESMNELFMEIK